VLAGFDELFGLAQSIGVDKHNSLLFRNRVEEVTHEFNVSRATMSALEINAARKEDLNSLTRLAGGGCPAFFCFPTSGGTSCHGSRLRHGKSNEDASHIDERFHFSFG
jgi:hypothetical protein